MKHNKRLELFNKEQRNIYPTWNFNNESFKTIDFPIDENGEICFNNILKIKGVQFIENDYTFLVYHAGDVWKTLIYGNYFPRTVLYHIKNNKEKWTHLKNCKLVIKI